MMLNDRKGLKCALLFFFVFFSFNPAYSQKKFEKPYEFAWLSDVHIVKRNDPSVNELKRSVRDINKDRDIKFTIITGDIADFGEASVLYLAKGILDSLKMPYYIVPGNHDTKWSASGATAFDCIFGHHNISFNYNDIKFVGFQTGPILRRGYGYISPDDYKWLEHQLESARQKGKIVIPFTHYPLRRGMSNWRKVTQLFRKYEVPVILSGHYHRYGKFITNGITNLVTRTNRKKNNESVGYTIVKVDRDSLYFIKREPDVNKTEPWISLPYRHVIYAESNSRPSSNNSINKEYPEVRVIWKRSFTAGISSQATYKEDRVVFGDRGGFLHCLSVSDGREIWQFKAGKAIFSTPAIADGKVVFGSTDGYIYCVDLDDGDLIWKLKTDNYVVGSPAIRDDVVYIGASDWKFRAINLQTGKIIWVFDKLKGWVQTKPAVYKGKVYFGAWDNYFYALDKKTGKLVWKWARTDHERYPSAFYSPAACWPVASGDRVFIAGPDLKITAFNACNGDVLWRTDTLKLNEALGISEDGSKLFAKLSYDSALYAFSTRGKEPEILWKRRADYGFDNNESPIVEKDGVVYFTFINGMIIALSAKDGAILWEYKMGQVMLNGATPVNNNEVIISDVDGNIRLLGYRPT